MNIKELSHAEIGTLRDQSNELLGKKVVIDRLNVPDGQQRASDTIVNTKGNVALAVSQVELFPHLIAGTKYHDQFHRDEKGETVEREADETFAFQGQGGVPIVSIVLPDQEDAIAVIKRVLAEDGQELTWAAALERLGLDRTQFKNFVAVADGIQTTRKSARIRLQTVRGLPNDADTLKERPNVKVPNLDSVTKLSRGRKNALKELLPELLEAEK